MYTKGGSSSIMISALRDHALTSNHKDAVHLINARKRLRNVGKGPMDHGMRNIVHTEKKRIITCMKIVYFCALEDIPLDKYPNHCKLLRELDMPNMPTSDEYGSYVNAVSGKEMLMAIKDHIKMKLLCDIRARKGPIRCVFIKLLSVENGNAKCIFDIVNKFLQDNMLDIRRLIAIATDGVLARFQESMPHILGVHCIAHRQALAAKDDFVTHPYVYAFVDKVANKVYSWLGKSSKRHDELWKIMTEYDIVDMRALQIHSVRWLSRGQVMERLVNIMPAILMQWQHSEKKWYKNITIFSVQFMIHFLADSIPMGANKRKGKELSESDDEDEDIDLNSFPSNLDKEIGSLEECICMAKIYVKNILESLDRRFEDLSIYNAFKIFSPSSMTHEWINRIINRLNINTHMIDIRKCMNEREDFVGMLCRVAEHKSMHDAWKACIDTDSWWDLYLEMMKVWQIALVILASTSACERGFSRQNFIKSTSRSSLGLDTLDALMLLSIDARGIHHIDWEDVFDMWTSAKKRRAMPLD
ncbi:hypothetical protein KP509_06G002200 [Ceratopteris richardii]|uniref:Uncharacterized protein n=1 Tax=Ceratopteris richardii TaxID=49495 RepID=A0A8T2UFA1_CERRI|nr:hypothetical protein KP509_06G002200 [Ceratopteris richardii]